MAFESTTLDFPDYFKSELMETFTRSKKLEIRSLHFPDYFKSELMETLPCGIQKPQGYIYFPDYFKSELMETSSTYLLGISLFAFPITSNRN